jgi:hypothetical protein
MVSGSVFWMHNPQQFLQSKLFPLIASMLVYPLWIWLAIYTKHCLQIVTRRSIPFSKRTIWLVKVLALIVGAGGVFAAVDTAGVPWFLAVLPAGLIVYLAIQENVQDLVPPRPPQDTATYQLAWREYWRLRNAALRSWRWFGAAFITTILMTRIADRLSHVVQLALGVICMGAIIGAIAVVNLNLLKWMRWPCPRCGCSFRGFWGRLWLPKSCAYCGLPREEQVKGRIPS